jgi:hypothetical protein
VSADGAAAPIEAIGDPTDVSPAWLTGALRGAGALPDGEVLSVEIRSSHPTAVSTVARLAVDYSPDAPASAPTRLFLKTPHPNRPPDFAFGVGERETTFYRRLAAAMSDLPLVRCYSALADAPSRRWHVLMDDLTDTHEPTRTPWPLPPPPDVCESAIDSLARLHAHWWGKSLPEPEEGAPRPPAMSPAARVEFLRERVDAFAEFLGERLSPRRRDTFAAVLAALPGLWRWRADARPMTLVHGDAHFWNFLFPRAAGAGPVYLCDWQSWSLAEPTRDLAYMVGLHWFRDHRERFEQPLARRYHARLQAEGVGDYSWDACWEDYRYSMIQHLFVPTGQWRGGLNAAIWWQHLERGMAAFDDLGCAELLGR